jgi:hypothetical protein
MITSAKTAPVGSQVSVASYVPQVEATSYRWKPPSIVHGTLPTTLPYYRFSKPMLNPPVPIIIEVASIHW